MFQLHLILTNVQGRKNITYTIKKTATIARNILFCNYWSVSIFLIIFTFIPKH